MCFEPSLGDAIIQVDDGIAIDGIVGATDRLGKAFGKVEETIGETGKLVEEVRSSIERGVL